MAQRGRFRIYVYDERGQPHHRPHCNVRWSDGDAQVALPSLVLLDGDPLPRAAWRLVNDHLADLVAAWNRLNPERPIHEHRDPTSGAEGA